MDYEHKSIAISDIFLDSDNPRHDVSGSQPELIKAMIDEQDKKLLRLAQSIVDIGINPSKLFLTTPYESNSGKYVVLEGNRRITALKLLQNLSSLPPDTPKSFSNTIKKYSAKFHESPIAKLNCLVFHNRDLARPWIDLEHDGESGGAGVVRWNAIQKLTSRAGKHKHAPELQVLLFVLRNSQLTEEEYKLIATKLHITTLARMLNTEEVRDKLGLIKDKGKGVITSNIDKNELARSLKEFLLPFASGGEGTSVTDLKRKEQRLSYINKRPKKEFPDTSHLIDEPYDLLNPSDSVTSSNHSDKEGEHKKKNKPLPTSRATIIPGKFVLPIEHPRANKIFHELKTLNVRVHNNAGAVLLRVFLELSLDIYIDKEKIDLKDEKRLLGKIKKVANKFQQNGTMSEGELKSVYMAAESNTMHGLFSTNTLNAYVHNIHIQPKADDLITTWEDMKNFMSKLWE